jgi:hypothetical protein
MAKGFLGFVAPRLRLTAARRVEHQRGKPREREQAETRQRVPSPRSR